MKFKLDECVDVRLAKIFASAGYNVHTVYDENISGESDNNFYSICLKEKRAIITHDMDFSNPFRYSPIPTQGIIVLRNPSQILSEAKYLVELFISRLKEEIPCGHLWVVDRHGIRIWPEK